MKVFKKTLSFIMVLLLFIVSLVIAPVSVSARQVNGHITTDEYEYVVWSDDTVSILDYMGNDTNVVVPAEIDGYPVVSIEHAYSNNKKIKTVTIEDGVERIGGMAFENCNKLESISIPDSVYEISGSAFYNCSVLKEIIIPDSVTDIGDNAFAFCNALTEITIPESVVSIGEKAFYGSSLSTINISDNPELVIAGNALNATNWYESQPDGVVYLDRFLLNYKGDMPKKLSVNVKEGTEVICSGAFSHEEESVTNRNLVSIIFPSTLRRIEGRAFYNCVKLETVDLPDSLELIDGYAFGYCKSIKSATIPKGVTDLRSAFARSGLESVTMLGNPTFWSDAFYDCENLREVSLPDTMEKIDAYAFGECSSLKEIHLPGTVDEICGGAFYECEKLSGITADNDIYKISNSAFEGTKWYDVQPDGLVYFGNVLIGYKGDTSAMTELTVPEGTKSIAGGAFSEGYKNLQKVELPEGLLVIGDNAFRETPIKSIVIPKSVAFIGYFAFCNCLELESVVINGKGVIEYDAFINCIKLTDITVSPNIYTIAGTALGRYYSIFETVEIVDGVVIYGCEGSAAHKYAEDNGIEFESITWEGIIGDADLDGKITVKDATHIQKHIAGIISIDDTTLEFAEVNGDSNVNIKDATMIQKFVAGIISSFAVGL